MGLPLASPSTYTYSDNVGRTDIQPVVLVDLNTGLPVAVGTPTASEAHIGQVSEDMNIISVTPTITASSPYASGNSVGGKITIASALRVSGGTGMLQSLQLIDKSNSKPALYVAFFNADPTAATLTDKTAFVYSTDITKQIRLISISSGDWVTVNSIATCDIGSIGRIVKATTGTSLYAAVILNGSTPTFASSSDIILNFGFFRG